MALKHDRRSCTHRLCDNHSFKTRDTCLLVVRKVNHSSGIPRKGCNIVNNTICLTATLIGIRVVVGGWKNLVFTIQTRELRHRLLLTLMLLCWTTGTYIYLSCERLLIVLLSIHLRYTRFIVETTTLDYHMQAKTNSNDESFNSTNSTLTSGLTCSIFNPKQNAVYSALGGLSPL